MNKKQMKDKMEQLEQLLAYIQESIGNEETYDDDYVPATIDNEKGYTGSERRNIGTTVPYWVIDYYWEVLIPKFDDRIKPYHRRDITPADIVRHLVYAAMLNPEAVLLSTYDEIKHLKDQ